MKSKDQQLLEEAYLNTRLVKEESVDVVRGRMMENETSSKRLSDEEILARYNKMVKQLHDQEITYQQWTALSLNLLGDIVNPIAKEAKIPEVPERDISEEEDEQMISKDLNK